jgi:hypothetical protein
MGILFSRLQFRGAALQPESFQWDVQETCSQPPNLVLPRSRSDRLADAAPATYCRHHAAQETQHLSDTPPRPPSVGSTAGLSETPLSPARHDTCLSIPTDPQYCFVCGLPASESCSCCDESFCRSHVYFCSDCQLALCAGCLDTHHADGHWSDSDTARAMADSIQGTFNRGCQELNCPVSTASNTTLDKRRSPSQAIASLLSACLFSIRGTFPLEAIQ